MHFIRVYSKPNCCLCQEALDEIESLRMDKAFQLEVVNILTSPELYELHKHSIPVVEIDGQFAGRRRISRESLLRWMESSGD